MASAPPGEWDPARNDPIHNGRLSMSAFVEAHSLGHERRFSLPGADVVRSDDDDDDDEAASAAAAVCIGLSSPAL